MSTVATNGQWEPNIRQVDINDLITGGDDGTLNIAHEQLMNRCIYLKNRLIELNRKINQIKPGTMTNLI